MRKVIEITDTKIIAICDNLDSHGRLLVIDFLCSRCPIYKHPERGAPKDLHCLSSKRYLAEQEEKRYKVRAFGKVDRSMIV